MLLVISDLHLEEYRALPDPLLDRFFDMIESVCKRAARQGVSNITFVLLGDILECLKNTRWLHEVRPWDTSQFAVVDDTLAKVVGGVLETNQNFFDRLKHLLDAYPLTPLYIFGNHDAILRGSEQAKTELKGRVPRLQFYEGSRFDDPDHQVTMLHGHEWDPDNRAPVVQGIAPFGDGVVVEFIANLPVLVADDLKLDPDDSRIAFLLEIDNVRPQTPKAISRWVKSELKRNNDAACGKAVDRAFGHTLEALQKLIRSKTIQRGSFSSWQKHLLKVVGPIRAIGLVPEGIDEPPNYADHARQALNRSNHRFLVCGHTHLVETVPMRLAKDEPYAPMYFNTGAWRRVCYRAENSGKSAHPFRNWDEACLMVFHSLDEQRKHGVSAYEMHRGLLGF